MREVGQGLHERGVGAGIDKGRIERSMAKNSSTTEEGGRRVLQVRRGGNDAVGKVATGKRGFKKTGEERCRTIWLWGTVWVMLAASCISMRVPTGTELPVEVRSAIAACGGNYSARVQTALEAEWLAQEASAATTTEYREGREEVNVAELTGAEFLEYIEGQMACVRDVLNTTEEEPEAPQGSGAPEGSGTAWIRPDRGVETRDAMGRITGIETDRVKFDCSSTTINPRTDPTIACECLLSSKERTADGRIVDQDCRMLMECRTAGGEARGVWTHQFPTINGLQGGGGFIRCSGNTEDDFGLHIASMACVSK